ncbi:hypothetical protein I203_102670 [Kwoniella mangroviensis CBS 8507]|uniref:uncharacterized protein n=1 Tax=Kwoniella mangroviensis CBS 8507 TaxID=1296122 RepID=UPI003041F190
MSQFDAAPPNTYAGGRDDNLRIKDGALPINASNDAEGDFDMVAYKRDTPLWKRIKDHSLTQMILLSIQAFCGLAMADAIAGLLGVGWLLLLLTISRMLYHTLLWLESVSSVVHSSINSVPINSEINGFSLSDHSLKDSVQVLGTLPNQVLSCRLHQVLSTWPNHIDGVEGGVTPDTYIIFLIIECLAIPFALLISPLDHVVRSDGTRIRVSEKVETAQECRLIKKTWRSKLICYLLYGPSGHSSTEVRGVHVSDYTSVSGLVHFHHSSRPSSASSVVLGSDPSSI